MEEQQYQQQPQLPMQQYSSSPHAELGALQYQLEGDDIVYGLIKTFRGIDERYDPVSKRYIEVRVSEPLCNDLGISRIKSRLTTFLIGMKVYALSDLDNEYIAKSVMSLGDSLIADIQDNWNTWEIKSQGAASDMVRTITDTAYAVMKKGNEGTYLRFLTKTHSVQESRYIQEQQAPKKGTLDFLFKKKKE